MSQSTILLAESDTLIRTPLAAYLRDCGYAVLEASDGTEALLLLQREKPSIDLVLTAANLDGEVSGFELARWTREKRPGIRVLLAGSVEKAADVAADLCDEGPHLKRPYEQQFVVDRIKRLLASRGGNQGGALMWQPPAALPVAQSGTRLI